MIKKPARILTALLSVLILLSLTSASAVTELESEQGSSYQYGYWKNVLSAPTAYTCTSSMNLRELTGASGALEDLAIGENGECYVADKKNNCIYVLGPDFGSSKTFKEYTADGEKHPFMEPEGLFTVGGKIYIANTAEPNIVVLDTEGNTLEVIEPPTMEEMTTNVKFEPIKVAVDTQGRMFIISRNQTQGIVKLNSKGEFIGYLGAIRVNPSPIQLFYRAIASDEMKSRMLQFIPTEYSNLTVDKDGFVYCIVGTLNSGDIYSAINSRTAASRLPIRKINGLGNDILDNTGIFPPVGDIDFAMYGSEGGASTFFDVAVSKDGVYSVLDDKRNRIFTYDALGNLLYVFGGKGNAIDQLSQPVAIEYFGDSIYVLDKATETVKRFTPTNYAKNILSATKCHLIGEYEKENQLWHQIKKEYISSDLAYLGIGRYAYINGNYDEAMKYFKMINNKTYYSKALSMSVRKKAEVNILWLIPAFAVAVAAVVIGFRYALRALKRSKSTTVRGVLYGGHVILHPFDGFWDIKHEGRGNIRSATVILAAAFFVDVLFVRFQPYLFNSLNLAETNVFLKGLSDIILPVMMWVVSNWCFTTLFDGKGTVSYIYTATCYSLFPFVVFVPVILAVSQVFTADVQPIYSAMLTIIYIWIGFLLFSSTLTIHQFTFTKTIAMILLILVGIAILIFISLLCFTLVVDIVNFLTDIFRELTY